MKGRALLFACLSLVPFGSHAQDATPSPTQAPTGLNPDVLENSLLQDYDGDGVIEVIAFGDSLTRGTGDFSRPGETVEFIEHPAPGVEAGYPKRLEQWLNVSVSNAGDPGEEVEQGLFRFANIIPSRRPDVVLISEGANDAISREPGSVVFHSLQAMVNIARVSGAQPIIGTINPVCCGHAGSAPFIREYNRVIRLLSSTNSIPLFDTGRAFSNTCNVNECTLLNLPEGLHPNTAGYDVQAEAVAAALLNIDLFAPNGPTELEQALGFSPGTVRTKPDTVSAPTPTPAP